MFQWFHQWRINRARRAAETELALHEIKLARGTRETLAIQRQMQILGEAAWPTGSLADFVNLTPSSRTRGKGKY